LIRTDVATAQIAQSIRREEVGVATWEGNRSKNRRQVGDPSPVDGANLPLRSCPKLRRLSKATRTASSEDRSRLREGSQPCRRLPHCRLLRQGRADLLRRSHLQPLRRRQPSRLFQLNPLSLFASSTDPVRGRHGIKPALPNRGRRRALTVAGHACELRAPLSKRPRQSRTMRTVPVDALRRRSKFAGR
jgi:hypothetical protein